MAGQRTGTEQERERCVPEMDVRAREQYLARLRLEYIGADKKAKTKLLNEAEKRTGLARKYLVVRLRADAPALVLHRSSRRKQYGAEVATALARCWEVFDFPCGQRLAPILRAEVPRLRRFGELHCSDEVAAKLQRVSPKTIDRLLTAERERLRLNRYRRSNIHPLLYQQIPVKLTDEWDRQQAGNLQLDFVTHSGQSAAGHYAYTLSAADIASGWWEGQAMLGRSQHAAVQAFAMIRERMPFRIREVHPDNDSCLINSLLLSWCSQRNIAISRSRPLHKNDNAWVEQRNWTHVRRMVGYRRYDTQAQVDVLNSLLEDVALFKNFFQPVLRLAGKRRTGGKLQRTYEAPITPYQWLLTNRRLSPGNRKRLRELYSSLNPAELKRRIDEKRNALLASFENPGPKGRTPTRRMAPHLVRSFMTQPRELWLGS